MTRRTVRKPPPQNGPAIREIRQREGLKVSELAVAIGVSDMHVRNIENEHKPARPEHLALIAKALNCAIAAIRRQHLDEDVA